VREELVLAIDIGTTNCKTMLIDPTCKVVAKESTEYPLSSPKMGWAEQDPNMWWEAVRRSVAALISGREKESIVAVGLSGQMHGLVALDKGGEVIRPAILWNDQRAEPECREIYDLAGGRERLLDYTNNAMLPGYTGGKLLWMRRNEHDLYKRIDKILLPKDYIRYRLTGVLATDVSDASGTGLFDVRKRTWSRELLGILQLPAEWIVPSYESTEVLGTISGIAARDLGLSTATRVVAGGGDAVMQTIGSGAIDDTEVLAVIGTGGNITISNRTCPANTHASAQVFCHVLPDRWVSMGVTLNAGNCLRWFRDVLGDAESAIAAREATSAYEILGREAEVSGPGAGGLIFLPYLQGERSPHTDSDARGCLVGMNLRSGKADVIRAVMEGVALSMYDVLNSIWTEGRRFRKVVLSGGGAKSKLWRQIMADVFRTEVVTRENGEDASAIGAGVIAGIAAGLWKNTSDATAGLRECSSNCPDEKVAELYGGIYDIYRGLYPSLSPSFKEMRRLAHSQAS